MTTGPQTEPPLMSNVRIGNEAGWLLTFHRETSLGVTSVPSPVPVLSVGSDQYYADIHAGLPSGLEGGTYTFIVEGLPDDLYGAIAQRGDQYPTVVRLYLFWREVLTGFTGALRNLVGLTGSASAIRPEDIPGGPVAVLRIVSLSRKAGARHYETTIVARERVFEAMNRVPLCGAGIEAATPTAALAALRSRISLPQLTFHGVLPNPDASPPVARTPGEDKVQLAAGRPLAELLGQLASSMEQRSNRYGRGMLLVRDDTLHLGTRPIPLTGGIPAQLTPAAGLVEVQAQEPLLTDPGYDRCSGTSAPSRRQFTVTLKGRPDLKPGDVVLVAPSEEDAGSSPRPAGLVSDLLSGSLLPSLPQSSADPVALYVAGVEHKLSRTAAFTTTVTGIELPPGRDDWDAHTPNRAPAEEQEHHPDPAVDAARAVRRVARNVAGTSRHPDVAEVRAATTSGGNEPPVQTELVWRGLAPSDGRAHQSRRLDVERDDPTSIQGVSYLTPFAWGPCGLVLPRYPGSRVLLVHRDGSSDDPLDAGALWEAGSAPPSHPGDWWLILPTEVADRESLTDDQRLNTYSGKATNDLIDADGNRCIEVGALTIRVGANGLTAAGTRPQPPSADVAIEHADGKTKLLVKADGTIEIHAAKHLTLAVDDGAIELRAKTVDVHVSDSMNVTE
jgi:hypothetical protein